MKRLGLPAFGIAVLLLGVMGRAKADVPNDGDRGALLGAWIGVQASQQRTERRFTGGALLGVGSGALGYGIARLAVNPNNELSKGGGVALLAAGAFATGLGIFRLVVKSEAEEVSERWAAARAKGVDALTVARFEGEFYAAAQHARRVQLLTRWLGVATAAGGVVVLAVTPFADLSPGGRVSSYVGGGLLVLGGSINIASSLVTPPPQEAWDSYQKGLEPPSGAGRLWGVAPVVAPGYGGLVFAMTTGK